MKKNKQLPPSGKQWISKLCNDNSGKSDQVEVMKMELQQGCTLPEHSLY